MEAGKLEATNKHMDFNGGKHYIGSGIQGTTLNPNWRYRTQINAGFPVVP